MTKPHRRLLFVAVLGLATLAWGMWHRRMPAQVPTASAPRLQWEPLGPMPGLPKSILHRAPVPGGWLVCARGFEEKSRNYRAGAGYGIGMSSGLTFVPDPEHNWK